MRAAVHTIAKRFLVEELRNGLPGGAKVPALSEQR